MLPTPFRICLCLSQSACCKGLCNVFTATKRCLRDSKKIYEKTCTPESGITKNNRNSFSFLGKDSGPSVVAVKTLKENANEKEKSDLISELQVMKMLEPHPNVVRLLGCCTDKEPIFLIMEYITKGKLQSYLRNSRAERYYNNMHSKSKYLTSRDLTSFVYQVAKGMEYLSSNGVSSVYL